jgi:hypothetical protein
MDYRKIKKVLSMVLCAVFLISSVGTAAADVPETVQAKLVAVETAMYGGEQTGAILDRINHLEKDYTDSYSTLGMMDRMDNLYATMFDNTRKPSVLTQMNAIEWAIMHQVSMASVQDRVTNMEMVIQGKVKEGTYKSRIAALAKYAFGDAAIPLVQSAVPANTLVKIKLVTPIQTKVLKEGDTVKYQVAEDVIENGILLFAKGAPGEGVVTKSVPARNFGRNAEINIDFKTVKSVDGTTVDMFLGEKAKKEMQQLAMAAGASAAGMVLLGPVGIVAGIFVQGKNIDVPAGTEMYIQTKSDCTLYGIQTTTVK